MDWIHQPPPPSQKKNHLIILNEDVKCVYTLLGSGRELRCFCPSLFWTQGQDLDPAALDVCTGLYCFAGLPHSSPNVELIECWAPHNTQLRSKALPPLKLGLVAFRKPCSRSHSRGGRGEETHRYPQVILVFNFQLLLDYWPSCQTHHTSVRTPQTIRSKSKQKRRHDTLTMNKVCGRRWQKDWNN